MRDRLSAAVSAATQASELAAAAHAQFETEKRRRKAAEARVRELEEQLANAVDKKRGTM